MFIQTLLIKCLVLCNTHIRLVARMGPFMRHCFEALVMYVMYICILLSLSELSEGNLLFH